VGYEEEGQLTGRLRKKPYSVVLLDEIEKAHPEALDIFLQLFDEGRLTDAKGRTIDARNAIFIMTSNLGGNLFQQRPIGFGAGEEVEGKSQEVMEAIKEHFRPEFLNRIDEVVMFRDLGVEEVVKIAAKMLGELEERLRAQEISLEVTEEVLKRICQEGFDPQYGARPLARVIERLVTKPLADRIVKGEVKEGDRVVINGKKEGIVFAIN